MHSANWYVRCNAAASLEGRSLSYEDLVVHIGGNDRYAREMLAYQRESRKLREEKGAGRRMRDFIQFFLYCVECFFILYMVGYASFLFLSVTVGTSTLYAAKRRNALKNELSNEYYVPVSIIVPAYNEAVTIEATVRSLLALDYRLYEIIVVDDGSSDDTSRVVQHAFGMHRIDRPHPAAHPLSAAGGGLRDAQPQGPDHADPQAQRRQIRCATLDRVFIQFPLFSVH